MFSLVAAAAAAECEKSLVCCVRFFSKSRQGKKIWKKTKLNTCAVGGRNSTSLATTEHPPTFRPRPPNTTLELFTDNHKAQCRPLIKSEKTFFPQSGSGLLRGSHFLKACFFLQPVMLWMSLHFNSLRAAAITAKKKLNLCHTLHRASKAEACRHKGHTHNEREKTQKV